ncbi:MAG: FAD-dependent oxidoreductase, partial [Deltaproteobacteria bacterium]|nr:FAD-dependent oxidoreductase [Deltaproteobacteria bacterium]
MTQTIDCAVIGAGVVGAALAQRLAASGQSVAVLEKFERVAEGVTSRNSGVIHSGIYYPVDSLKARLCIRGKELLYAWCA